MRKWVIMFVFLAIVFGAMYYFTFGYFSVGKKGGFVSTLSKRGFVFKTYEGELRMGGILDGDGGTMNSSEWSFSVSGSNKEAIDKIESAIKNGHRVSLTYQQKFFQLPWNGETKFFVTEVDVLDSRRGGNALPGLNSDASPAPVITDSIEEL